MPPCHHTIRNADECAANVEQGCYAPAPTFEKLQRAQNNLARAGVAPTPGRCFARYTGFRWGSGSSIKWLFWLTRCGPQPLQRISASWYRPVHHLGLCALPMLRCWSFLAYTSNWPVALFLLFLHPSGTLYLLTFDYAKTFSLSNATKPISSNSLSPPVLHQAPLYLRTKALYKSVVIIIIIIIISSSRSRSNIYIFICQKGSSNKWKKHQTHTTKTNKQKREKNYAQIGQASEQCYHQRTLKTSVNQR